MNRKESAWLALVILLVVLAGCGPEMVWVTKRPAFDYQKVQRIGVMVFTTPSKEPVAEGAAVAVADKIARFLIEHRDYQVTPPQAIAKAIEDKKHSPPLPLDADAVKRIGEITGVDALVTGTVTSASFKRTEQTRYQPEYTDTGYGIYREGSRPYQSVRNEAQIAAEIKVYDTRSGLPIWTDVFAYTSFAQGTPPPLSREQVLDDAADQVAAKLFLGLVVHKNRIKVPDDSLLTSEGFVGEQVVNRTKNFSAGKQNVFVVVRLGPDFAGTKVLVSVFRKDRKDPVAQAERVWGKNEQAIGIPFSIKDLTSKAGFGDYEVKYFIGGEQVRSADFRIRPG